MESWHQSTVFATLQMCLLNIIFYKVKQIWMLGKFALG